MFQYERKRTQEALRMHRDRATNIALEKACDRGMTFKNTQGHYSLLDRPYGVYTSITSYDHVNGLLLQVTTSLSSTVSKIGLLPLSRVRDCL